MNAIMHSARRQRFLAAIIGNQLNLKKFPLGQGGIKGQNRPHCEEVSIRSIELRQDANNACEQLLPFVFAHFLVILKLREPFNFGVKTLACGIAIPATCFLDPDK